MRLTTFALASAITAGLLGPVVGSAPVAASAASVTGDPRTAPSTQVRACRSSDYKPVYEGRDAAAGIMYIHFSMVRIQGDGPGKQPCLQRTPIGMHWIDTLDGKRVGDWAKHDPNPPKPFVVQPGGVADVTIRQPNPRNYPEKDCRPKRVAGIQAYMNDGHDKGVYGSTGGQDVMCSRPGKAVPTVYIKPQQS